MDNPERPATQGTHDEEKQKHNTTCVRYHNTQTNNPPTNNRGLQRFVNTK